MLITDAWSRFVGPPSGWADGCAQRGPRRWGKNFSGVGLDQSSLAREQSSIESQETPPRYPRRGPQQARRMHIRSRTQKWEYEI
jgi:hypothetical protein